jgi:uncharacterized membrane protein YccC
MVGEEVRGLLRTVQWTRGMRAVLVIGSAMVVCHLAGVPPGAAAIGGFDALLVDNGGPYRTRWITMATTLVGGAAALLLGSIMPTELGIAVFATMVVAFAIIFSRVLSQPLASSSVLILVLYFAGVGGTQHTLHEALISVGLFLLGGLWAVVLSLGLWPVDPFRPARLAVAHCYASLAGFTSELPSRETHPDNQQPDPSAALRAAHGWQGQQRLTIERAGATLAATAARAPSRTIRARNLTVLLETSDLLLARMVRLSELADVAREASPTDADGVQAMIFALTQWMAGAERAIEEALLQRPADGGASFAREGSQRVQFIVRRRAEITSAESHQPGTLLHHLLTEERDALLEIEIAFNAVWAIWSGTEVKLPWKSEFGSDTTHGDEQSSSWDLGWIDSGWRDALEANWTLKSVMLRHALRVTVVGAVDVVVMRLIHIDHGFWLPMTSIILLQPYSAGTARKSVQRVTGTIAGGILAAVLAAAIPSQAWMTPVITVLASLTVATFAVDYAVYCFFLTPTFVLMSLPHAHDWRYAGIRIGTTLAGALIAIVAMRLLWPERAEVELGRLLRRGAEADAAYLRALLHFWEAPDTDQRSAERELLAPARRACGLASNDAEEAVDRVMQEPQFGRLAQDELTLRNEALTFATYLRRLTQSITTLAVVGRDTPGTHTRLERLAQRMEDIAHHHAPRPDHAGGERTSIPANVSVAEEQLQRIERQVGILEKASALIRA